MSGQDHPRTAAVLDRFDRAELGGDWEVCSGEVGIVHGHDLGVLSKDAPMKGLGIVAWRATDFGADQFSEAVISPEADPKALLQVFVRRHPPDGRRYGFHWNPADGGRWELKLDGGPDTVVLATTPASRPAPGDTIRVEAMGNTIKGFHNGAEVVSAVDSALAGPGQPGVALNVARGVERFPAPFVRGWTGGHLPPRPGEASIRLTWPATPGCPKTRPLAQEPPDGPGVTESPG